VLTCASFYKQREKAFISLAPPLYFVTKMLKMRKFAREKEKEKKKPTLLSPFSKH
jgi:hypothetical protein